MAQTKQSIRDAYNAKTYRQFKFKVRKGSTLYDKLDDFISTKGTSLNFLVCKLLAEHFDVPPPLAHNDNDG